MATVGQIASWVIKRQAQGFSRTADVLPLINEVNKLFYKHECSQGVITDSDGGLPFLNTTNNNVKYTAPVVDGVTPWCVSGVYLRWPNAQDFGRYDYDYSEPPLVNTVDYMEFAGNYYYEYQFVRTLDALENVATQIIFSRNPGDSKARFRLLMYRKPTEIDSDRIQLSIPDRDGSHMMYFLPAVMKLVEAQNNGNYMEAVAYIEDVLKPKMWEVLNSGAQGRRHRTQSQYY